MDIDGCVGELPPVIVVPGGVGTCARGVGYCSMTFTSNTQETGSLLMWLPHAVGADWA